MTREDQIKKAAEIIAYGCSDELKAALIQDFPELAESEDERIRKRLINIVGLYYGTSTVDPERDECIAYLEKQKEPLPIPNKFSGLKSLMLQYLQSAANRKDDAEIEDDTDLWGRKILDYVWKYDEKQKEQPVEGIPDSVKFDEGFKTGREIGFREGVESVKPVEWSEEDRSIMDGIQLVLESWDRTHSSIAGLPSLIPSYISWLKSLRPQKLDASKLENFDPVDVLNRIKTEWPMAWEKVVGKQEWSEEDEEKIKDIIDYLECWNDFDHGSESFEEYRKRMEGNIQFMKSLRSSWKPSNEQMGALYDSIEWEGERAEDVDFILKSLYNDLKKLM